MLDDPESPDRDVGLLEQIADTALDDDYYVVRAGPHEQSRAFNTVLTAAVMAVFALLVATAAIQTRSDRPATERERSTLIGNIESRKSLLASREATAERLRGQVADLKSAVVGFDPAYEELRLIAADRGASGPGVRVRVTPGAGLGGGVSDRDLQTLVNGFWYAGAEAVSINGKRIGSLTSIRTAGGVIKVNYQSIGEPYEIVVIGDSETLEDRFADTAVGRLWEQRRSSGAVGFTMTRSDDLSVKAAPDDRLSIRNATAIEEDA